MTNSHLSPQDARPVRVQHRPLVWTLQPRLQDNSDGTSVISRLLFEKTTAQVWVKFVCSEILRVCVSCLCVCRVVSSWPGWRSWGVGSSDFQLAETEFSAAVGLIRPEQLEKENAAHPAPDWTKQLRGEERAEKRQSTADSPSSTIIYTDISSGGNPFMITTTWTDGMLTATKNSFSAQTTCEHFFKTGICM